MMAPRQMPNRHPTSVPNERPSRKRTTRRTRSLLNAGRCPPCSVFSVARLLVLIARACSDLKVVTTRGAARPSGRRAWSVRVVSPCRLVRLPACLPSTRAVRVDLPLGRQRDAAVPDARGLRAAARRRARRRRLARRGRRGGQPPFQRVARRGELAMPWHISSQRRRNDRPSAPPRRAPR